MKKFLFCFLLLSMHAYSQPVGPGYALSFDGVDDYVAIPHNNVLNVSTVTIEMWMYWEQTNGDDVDFLIGKDFEQLEIHTGGGAGTYGLRFIPTSGVYFDTDPYSISTGEWHHVAYMYDPSATPAAKCYIDGIAQTLTKRGLGVIGTAIVTSGAELRLGKRGDGSNMQFKGKLDDVRVWNTVRTQTEIVDNMNRHLMGDEPGLVAYYQMSDGGGTTLTDNSSNHVDGTLLNGVQWIASTAPLPVELVSFTAAIDHGTVTLNWKTATEVDNYGFEIQRQEAGVWRAVGFVEGRGTSSAPWIYSFTDAAPGSGRFLYRLKQIDRNGAYEFSQTALAEISSLPQAYGLDQNFPNPFNPSTRFRFSIAEAGRTTLTVFDMLGRTVATLVDETRDAGVHTVDWNAASVPSGVYIFRIQSGRFSSAKCCVIQK